MQEDFLYFCQKVFQKTGIDLQSYKFQQMKRRLDMLLKSNNLSNYRDYFNLISQDKEKYQEFLDKITINVSEFFRNPNQFFYLRDKILPDLYKENGPLKIWSAACSTGEEPYSVAMLIKEAGVKIKDKIIATDIDNKVLQKAMRGIYSKKSITNVPPNYLNKYFEKKSDDEYIVKKEIKDMVKFVHHNLLKDEYEKDYDLILCRNVVIYFTDETKQNLYKKFNQSLKPGGVLFTGNTELIFDAKSLGFRSIATFFYQKISN
ncbi:MAG TPA: protein-glutamate O-methyltransferase CheR [Clostridia bacterium]|nr:protein-glutamate O-methyltransferase CheR [Clostridia bacterium]